MTEATRSTSPKVGVTLGASLRESRARSGKEQTQAMLTEFSRVSHSPLGTALSALHCCAQRASASSHSLSPLLALTAADSAAHPTTTAAAALAMSFPWGGLGGRVAGGDPSEAREGKWQ